MQPSAAVGLVGDLGIQSDPRGQEEETAIRLPEIERARLPSEQEASGSDGVQRNAERSAEIIPGPRGDNAQRGACPGQAGRDVTEAPVSANGGDPVETFGSGARRQFPRLAGGLSEADFEACPGFREDGAGLFSDRPSPSPSCGRIGNQADSRGYGPTPGRPGGRMPGSIGPPRPPACTIL